MDEITNFMDMFGDNDSVQPLIELTEQIMALSDANLTDETIDVLNGMIAGAFTTKVREDSVAAIVSDFRDSGYTKGFVLNLVATAKAQMNDFIDELKPSANKRRLLNAIFSIFYEIFDAAAEQFGVYDIILPMQLEDGAQTPTYAHNGDACADLYAKEDMTLPAHSHSNMVPTGVHIALPEGWMAMIFPRSSMGAKTSNRLSNSVGIIDSNYRGQLGVLYDNLSDSDYTITTGDRVAQMLVMPSYKFRAEVVDTLPETDRGEGGFGSTGK